MATEPPSIHPTQQLRTPAGESVAIDIEMVPLIQALWALGLTTLGCCQDNGEYARARREMCPGREPTGHSGFIDYHLGWAWMKMPVADTTRLTEILLSTSFRDAITIRWQRGSWRLDIPVIYDPNSGMGPGPGRTDPLPPRAHPRAGIDPQRSIFRCENLSTAGELIAEVRL